MRNINLGAVLAVRAIAGLHVVTLAWDFVPGQEAKRLKLLGFAIERTELAAGVIFERWAKAQLRGGAYPGNASGFFQLAMDWYGKAMALSPQGNDDAILRWNACVRFMQQNPHLRGEAEEAGSESGFPDGAPAR